MYSNEKHLDQLITQFPGPQNFLRQLCEEEKRKTKDEIINIVDRYKARKNDLVQRAVKLLEYDTLAFKKHLPNSKHELQLLKNNDPDYDLLKRSLGLNSEAKELKNYSNKNIALSIYRVKSNVESCVCPSLLLLHGTKGYNVKGILKEGLRPSSSGSHGPGIYLTNSFEIAHHYGQCYVKDEGTAKHVTYLFVNKVKETLTNSSDLCRECKKGQSVETCQPSSREKKSPTLFVKSPFPCQDSNFSYEPVLKVFDTYSISDKQAKFKQTVNCKLDSDGNKILSGTFRVVNGEKRIAVAHHDLVTLAYLIEIETEQSERDLVKHILYRELGET